MFSVSLYVFFIYGGVHMIYVTGDLHGERQQIKQYIEHLSEGDILLIAGDFGLPWWPRQSARHFKDDKLLKLLAEAPFTTCYVDGNHENFDILKKFPIEEKWGGRVQNVKGVFHLMRGELYNIEGNRIFTFGGATSTDQEYRTPRISWWPQEVCSEEERNHAVETLEACNWTVDYVITHTAPLQFKPVYLHTLLGRDMPCLTANFLSEIWPKMTYKKWFFGHFHDDIMHDELKARLIYNDIIPLN